MNTQTNFECVAPGSCGNAPRTSPLPSRHLGLLGCSLETQTRSADSRLRLYPVRRRSQTIESSPTRGGVWLFFRPNGRMGRVVEAVAGGGPKNKRPPLRPVFNNPQAPRQLGWAACTSAPSRTSFEFALRGSAIERFASGPESHTRLGATLRLVRAPHAFAAPTVSAMTAPRVPSGLSGPTVESRAV